MPGAAHQRGLSLIELLVGMLLASIAVMAALSLYRTTGKSSAESRLAVLLDGQIASGQLAADKLLKNAGYGAASASYPADLLLVDNARLASGGLSGTARSTAPAVGGTLGGGQGVALLWRSLASGGYVYDGLYAPAEGGLWRLRGNGMALSGWTQGEALIVPPVARGGQFASASISTITLSRPATACRPYGIGQGGGKYTVTLGSNGAFAGQQRQGQTCLLNFHD